MPNDDTSFTGNRNASQRHEQAISHATTCADRNRVKLGSIGKPVPGGNRRHQTFLDSVYMESMEASHETLEYRLLGFLFEGLAGFNASCSMDYACLYALSLSRPHSIHGLVLRMLTWQALVGFHATSSDFRLLAPHCAP